MSLRCSLLFGAGVLIASLLLAGCATSVALENAESRTPAASLTVEPTVQIIEATNISPTPTLSTMSSTIRPRKTEVRATRPPQTRVPRAVATQIIRIPSPTNEQTPAEATRVTAQVQESSPTPQSIPSELTIYGEGKHLVAIDAGHGGIDEGTYPIEDHGPFDYHESQINLAVAFRLRDILVANGIRVYLDRIDDYYLNPDMLDINGDGLIDEGDEQQLRVDLLNASGAELFLSLHQNASTYNDGSINPDRSGSTTYYCDARSFSDLSYRFATLVHQEVLDGLAAFGYESYDQGILDDLDIDDYEPKLHLIILGPQTDRIVRPSNMPAALDEPLFATNLIEAWMLPQDQVQDVLAQAYARAIIRYFSELDGG